MTHAYSVRWVVWNSLLTFPSFILKAFEVDLMKGWLVAYLFSGHDIWTIKAKRHGINGIKPGQRNKTSAQEDSHMRGGRDARTDPWSWHWQGSQPTRQCLALFNQSLKVQIGLHLSCFSIKNLGINGKISSQYQQKLCEKRLDLPLIIFTDSPMHGSIV